MIPNFTTELLQGASVALILGLFLRYFMTELKEVRKQMDTNRQEDSQMIRDLMERVIRMEERSRETLQDVSNSNTKLAEAVNNLGEQFSKN